MHEDITVGTHVNRPTVIHPGLEHEEILYRFLTVLERFVACYADSATENANEATAKRRSRDVRSLRTATLDLELLPLKLVFLV